MHGKGRRMDMEQQVQMTFEEKLQKLAELAEEVVDPDDIEMLEDLIVAATNEALRKMEEDSQEKMGKVTGGLGGMGGGFPF